MKYISLAKEAAKAKEKAYAPYSGFHVGASLLTRSGKIFTGCNIESASYGLTICAERTAVFKAVSEGEKEFTAIAVASDAEEFCPPCGACRQVLSELCGDIDIVLVSKNKEEKIYKLSELLPLVFTGNLIPRDK